LYERTPVMKIFSKRALKWIGIVAGAVIAMLLIANAIWVWTTGSRLEKKLAALRAAGEPLSLADLARKPIPPQKNAAVFLRRAMSDLEAMEKEWANVYGSEGYQSGRLSESELKAVESALETYPKVIPLLEQAAACPEYDSQADYTVPPEAFLEDVQDIRGAARVLRFRALLLLARGEREEAMQTCITLFRLCRRYRQPMIVGYLVPLACRGIAVEASNLVLQAGLLPKDAREALEAELALQDGLEAYEEALKTERAYGLDYFRTSPLRKCWFVTRPLWNDATCYYLDMIDRHLAAAARPYSEVVATTPAIARNGIGFRGLADLVEPAVVAGRAAMERTRAAIRCLRVLNALQARPEQGGAETPKLSDLGLPVTATTDPFTGKPLQVKKLPGGWLVYSLGKDLKDDGGDFTEARDVGVGPPRPENNQ
jgi:tetratricopeptide (TPR) repeat protein